jgi:hypothetical protein
MDQRPTSDLEDTSEDSEIVQRHSKLEWRRTIASYIPSHWADQRYHRNQLRRPNRSQAPRPVRTSPLVMGHRQVESQVTMDAELIAMVQYN